MSSIKGLLETLDAQHPGVNLASPTHCSFLNCLVKPTIFFGGLVTNILLILIVYKNKHTKSLSSSKPLRYLLIGMLVSDVWFLIEEINVWFFSLLSQPDLSSYNGTCQIYTYLEHFFAISLEAYMLFADYILLSILFKKKKWAVSPEDIYNQFMVPTIKSHNDANNNEDSEIMMSERSQSLKSTAKKRSIISSRGIDLRKTFGRRWKRILLNGKEKKQLSGMVGAGKPGECRPISECDEVVEFCGSTENRVVETASRSGVGNVSASESAIDPNECSTNDVYAIANEVASNPQNGQPGRRVTYREVHSTQKRSSHHKQRKSQFFVLLDTTKFKNENIYYNILIKEKVVIILWIFICLYLLSFLLWIRGDSSKMGSRSSRSSVIENIVSSTTVATLARSTKRSGGSRIKNSTSIRMKTSTVKHTKPISSTVNYLLYNLMANSTEKIPNSYYLNDGLLMKERICSTFEFALNVFKVFLILVSALRLVTLLVNLFTSVAFHVKFRNEYINALGKIFKRKTTKKVPSASYRRVATQNIKNNKEDNKNDTNEANNDFGTTRAFRFSTFAFIYSTSEPIVTEGLDNTINDEINEGSSEREKREASLKTYFYQLHFNHFHFVRHYALMVFVYSVLIAPSVFDESMKSFAEIKKFLFKSPPLIDLIDSIKHESKSLDWMIWPTEEQKSEFYENFLELSRATAHSTKFFVYVIFSAHVSFYFEYIKSKPKECAKKEHAELSV